MNPIILDLNKLLHHVAADADMLGLKGSSPEGRSYGKLVGQEVSVLPELPGFYIWGKYENKGLWRTIYLGKAGIGKSTHLRARIAEELRDERIAVWCRTDNDTDRKKVIEAWLGEYASEAGLRHARRAALKSGATHIVAVAMDQVDYQNEDILAIEADLIETMNPIANRNRPRPQSSLQRQTIEVIRHFKDAIHRARPPSASDIAKRAITPCNAITRH